MNNCNCNCIYQLLTLFNRIRHIPSPQELTIIFGAEWAIEYLLPPLGEIIRHQSYLRRLSAVQALSLMATVMKPRELAITDVLPLVLLMATDNVSILWNEIMFFF
jgi:hypothetical protein